MNRWMGALTAIVLTAVLTSCGSGQGREESSESTAPTRASGSTALQGTRAVSVTVRKSGGKAGLSELRTFDLDQLPVRGPERAEAKSILRAASEPALTTVKMTPLPANVCCDRFRYVVRVVWDDGTSRTFRTLDDVKQPAVFDRFFDRLL